MATNSTKRAPSYHFTLFDGFIVGLHARHPSTFVVYATDHNRYWASSFRHKHLLQDHRNTSSLSGLFEAFAASFDDGNNIGGVNQVDDGESLLLDVQFSHHAIEHRITLTLAECLGNERMQLVSTLVADLYSSLAKWRGTAKAATKLANACMATKNPGNSKRLQKQAANAGIRTGFGDDSADEKLNKSDNEDSPTSDKEKKRLQKELSSLTTPLKQRGWKPTNHKSKGYFSQPEYVSQPYQAPRAVNPFSGTVGSPTALAGMGGTVGSSMGAGHSPTNGGTIRSTNGFAPPKRYGSTKDELRLQLLTQQQQLLAMQQENAQLLSIQHQHMDQRRRASMDQLEQEALDALNEDNPDNPSQSPVPPPQQSVQNSPRQKNAGSTKQASNNVQERRMAPRWNLGLQIRKEQFLGSVHRKKAFTLKGFTGERNKSLASRSSLQTPLKGHHHHLWLLAPKDVAAVSGCL
eukprot:TRINITY_DN68068_c3_g2_i5.p1 TRINITY_DN68068_c3_g2~~TRINITY_DN68068_c3_g2_i5.p1  ORF type:complete len:463 (+),score=20.58 TRINITY_DN68068_c3_g2_i5:55-1443(+)